MHHAALCMFVLLAVTQYEWFGILICISYFLLNLITAHNAEKWSRLSIFYDNFMVLNL